jgi:hypothetical protein
VSLHHATAPRTKIVNLQQPRSTRQRSQFQPDLDRGSGLGRPSHFPGLGCPKLYDPMQRNLALVAFVQLPGPLDGLDDFKPRIFPPSSWLVTSPGTTPDLLSWSDTLNSSPLHVLQLLLSLSCCVLPSHRADRQPHHRSRGRALD